MSLSVPEDWMLSGATLLIELPRNLACAGCHGGGCDKCERSGAVSLRSRRAEVETVEVTLPKHVPEDAAPSSLAPTDGQKKRSVVVRIPERGGLPPPAEELPRGNLLLSIRPGPAPSRGVTRLKTPSVPAPPIVPEILEGVEPPPEAIRSQTEPKGAFLYVVIAVVVAMAVAWLLRR
jgi:hypothetical protein